VIKRKKEPNTSLWNVLLLEFFWFKVLSPFGLSASKRAKAK
jgi:hypothetical protein